MSNTPVANFSGLASGIDTSGIIQKMVQVAQVPIKQLATQDDGYSAKLKAWQDFNTSLNALQTAVTTMTLPTTFNAATGTSSNSAVASITASAGATLGDHTLTVNALAQAQKIVTKSFGSGNVALGETGSFTLNGKSITLAATDTLADVSVKINAAQAGITASVINVAPGDFRMTLNSNATGTTNAISSADSGTGTVLADMGLISGAAGIRQAIGTRGAGSLAMGSATQTVANVLGLTNPAAGSVQINGTAVAIDLNTDSLTTIANNINAANITGVTAQVVALPDANGNITFNSKQQLQITGSGAAPTFTDSNNVLTTLGVLQESYINQASGASSTIINAQDAQFNFDGIDFTRSSNIVNDAVPGASIKLLSAGTVPAPATTTLSVSQNSDSTLKSVNDFATAFNAVQDYITAQNAFTPPSGPTGQAGAASPPLFSDSTLSQIQSQLVYALGAVSGSNTLESIGITLDGSGHLNVDSSKLTTALQTDPTQVANLFGLSGIADNASVKFVAAGSKTQSTNGQGYAVDITTAASQSQVTGSAVTAGATSASPETLTFAGALFPGEVQLTLTQGNTLQDTVNQINGNSSLNGNIYASIDSATNSLVLSSIQYGSGTDFSVISNQVAGTNNSGIGSAPTITAGVDVAGTINGEPATGKGRTLTGNSGNKSTEALQVLVSATAPGSYGHVTVTHGVADALNQALTQIMDPTNGAIIGAENSLNSQIADTEQQIQKMNDQVSAYTDYLNQMFSAMEVRVSELQQQGGAFAAAIGGMTSNSGSSNSSSSNSSSSKA